MLAMDVVDTLRHRTRIVDMELNEEAREEQLIARLKEIYGAQGIEVPEKILKDGVKALAEQRFVYKPPANTFSVKLAKLYVSRKKWLPGVTMAFVALLAMAAWRSGCSCSRRRSRMEAHADGDFAAAGRGPGAGDRPGGRCAARKPWQRRAARGRQERSRRREDAAADAEGHERPAGAGIRHPHRSRQERHDGFCRKPPNNPNATNYYIVVEAVAPGGGVLSVPIRNVEDGRRPST